MASAHDVAKYILKRKGSMTTWKLQKLVYYSQAWHLVWDDERLFDEPIEAWANGPVVRELHQVHRGSFKAPSAWPRGDSGHLTDSERASIDLVLRTYGSLSGHQLSALTHSEDPWRVARGDLPATARSQNTISLDDLYDFYSGLEADEDASPIDELDWHDWEDIDY